MKNVNRSGNTIDRHYIAEPTPSTPPVCATCLEDTGKEPAASALGGSTGKQASPASRGHLLSQQPYAYPHQNASTNGTDQHHHPASPQPADERASKVKALS